jgi:signal transduction histidine kinase
LGLSLSYDFVKAHGGEITVETQKEEGKHAGQAGTTFIIRLFV